MPFVNTQYAGLLSLPTREYAHLFKFGVQR